jgi:hypothetical protein
MFENLVKGHHGESFPHLCPGSECAIQQWIFQRFARVKHEHLQALKEHVLREKEIRIYRANGKTRP